MPQARIVSTGIDGRHNAKNLLAGRQNNFSLLLLGARRNSRQHQDKRNYACANPSRALQ
jgi:hypothetical protein